MRKRTGTVSDTAVLDMIPFSVFIKDLDSVYTYSNPANAEYSGYLPELIPGKTDFDLFSEESARIFQADDRIVIGNGVKTDRVEIATHNNRETIIRIIKRPYRDENGEIIGVMGIYWEITEELKNKTDLSDKRSQLRLALKAAEIGVWTWDFQQQRLFWDEQINRTFGNTGPCEGDEDDFKSFIHPDDREAVSEEFQFSDRNETEINTEYRIVRPDGTIRYVQTRGELHKDPENKPMKMIGVIHDITRKRLTEETLHSIVRLNQLVDDSSMDEILELILKEAVRLTDSRMGVLYFIDEDSGEISIEKWLNISDSSNRIRQKNDKARVPGTGLLAECLMEKKPVIQNRISPDENIPDLPEGMPPIFRKLAIPIIEKKKIRAVISVVNKSGPYEDFDGDQLSLLGENLWNIISRKRMMHALEEAHREAVESNKIKDRFFSIIAHDLSNPVSNIRILSDHLTTVISKGSPDMEVMQELSRILSRSVITAQDLLKNLLTWSRSQRKALEYQPEFELVKRPVTMAIAACSPIAEGKSIRIKSHWQEEDIVYADSNMLQTILRNILMNAIKFTDVGGEISLDVISGNKETSFRIQDNGIGMSEEKILSLFSIEEIRSTRGTNAEGGTGLGLLLCKEFVECHGGSIKAESSPGKGSIFTITLPRPEKPNR